jgi:hypothetical protein
MANKDVAEESARRLLVQDRAKKAEAQEAAEIAQAMAKAEKDLVQARLAKQRSEEHAENQAKSNARAAEINAQARADHENRIAARKFLGLSVSVIVVLAVLSIPLYVLPIIIAVKRGHPNVAAIAAVNILLGWIFIGWVAALVWALTAIERHGHQAVHGYANSATPARIPNASATPGKRIVIKR